MKHAHGPYAPRMRVLSSVCRRWVEKVELVVLPEGELARGTAAAYGYREA